MIKAIFIDTKYIGNVSDIKRIEYSLCQLSLNCTVWIYLHGVVFRGAVVEMTEIIKQFYN